MKNSAFLFSFLLLVGVFLTIGFVAPNISDSTRSNNTVAVAPVEPKPTVLGQSDPAPVWSADEALRYDSLGHAVSFLHPAQTIVSEERRRITITDAPNGPDDSSVFFLYATLSFSPYTTIEDYLATLTPSEDTQVEYGAISGNTYAKVITNGPVEMEVPPASCVYYLIENRQTLITLLGHECTPVESIFESLDFTL